MTTPEMSVLAITPENTLLHVASATEVVAHLEAEVLGPGNGAAPSMDFFDGTGRTLSLVTDPETGAVTLQVDASQPDPEPLTRQLVVDRIDSFLAQAQVVLTQELLHGTTPGLERVPRVQGDLTDVLATLAEAEGPLPVIPQPGTNTLFNAGSPLHNLGHRVFG